MHAIAPAGEPRLGRLDHPSGLDAIGAHHQFLRATVAQSSDALQIGIESAFIHVVGVADIVAHHWFFSTNFTYFGHL